MSAKCQKQTRPSSLICRSRREPTPTIAVFRFDFGHPQQCGVSLPNEETRFPPEISFVSLVVIETLRLTSDFVKHLRQRATGQGFSDLARVPSYHYPNQDEREE